VLEGAALAEKFVAAQWRKELLQWFELHRDSGIDSNGGSTEFKV
jgi:hypothetical protein